MRTVLIILLFVAMASPALAQQSQSRAPADPLQDICTGFLEQGGQGISGDRNKLCSCLVRETKARLTPQEMEIYNKAGTTGQPPPPAIMEKVIGIATACLTAQ